MYVYVWLWFDVEEGYNTTACIVESVTIWLWFDVEEGYNTTRETGLFFLKSCGLM